MALIVLDGTIVGVALPRMITDLHLTLADAEWVSALYSVIFAALLLPFGKLGDLKGRTRFFRLGVAVFVAGSALAGLSRSAGPLIAARALQGIGAAAVLPSSLSSVNALFRGRERAVAFGVWGAVLSGAAALGPLAGGWLTATWSWPLIFWINVPLGLGILLVSLRVLPADSEVVPGGLDPLSVVLAVLACGGGVFALIEGPTYGWWAAREGEPAFAGFSPIPLLAVVCALTMVLFLARQRRIAQPLLDLRLFSIATFTWGNAAAFAVAAGEFALVFILPLYLMGERGLTPLTAGVVLAAMAGGAFVAGASARHLARRFSPAGVVLLGLALEVGGVAVTVVAVRDAVSLVVLAGTLVIYGLGLGLASAQLTSTVLADVAPEASGQGSATQSTVRQLGAALGTAGAGTLIAYILPGRLSDALAGVAGAGGLIEQVTQSAGAVLPALARRAAAGDLGPAGESVVASLRAGFTDAVSLVLVAAAACLALGLAVAVRVWRVSTRGA